MPKIKAISNNVFHSRKVLDASIDSGKTFFQCHIFKFRETIKTVSMGATTSQVIEAS